MWTNEFRSTQSFVLLSPYCSLVSCAIFGRMQPKTGTTTSSIMNTTKSRQGNKRGIAKERNFVQSQDIGKVNKAEIKEAMDGVLKKMQGFDFTKFKEELGKRGFKVREARASTGKLNGYYVTARSGTEYKASEIGKGYTLAHIERTQSKLKCNSMNISHGNKLTPGSGSFQR
ncbi:relaxase/mobilization nuclease domain-containing protein [Bacteroides xylanisolvens]|nr:relaxase/mobilization nuclease domain-containing protein [Bacteroides xylanisolvens]